MDLVDFLENTPEADAPETLATDDQQPSDESTGVDNSEESADEDSPADDDAEEAESEDAKKQPSGLKFKVPVKGEDGADSTIEVDEKELIAGYQRHADYTRKTQELSSREQAITQAVSQKFEEGRNHFLSQAQFVHAAIHHIAGLRSPAEMAQLAQSDPAAWVQEKERAAAVQGVLSEIEQRVHQERAQQQNQVQQATQQQFQAAWAELSGKGIDKPKLAKIYQTIEEDYGIGKDVLGTIYDPKAVLVMRDAAAYRELVKKRADVTKKVTEAPKLPAQKQSVPRNEQQKRQLDSRFKSGKAKLSDLAAFIANS